MLSLWLHGHRHRHRGTGRRAVHGPLTLSVATAWAQRRRELARDQICVHRGNSLSLHARNESHWPKNDDEHDHGDQALGIKEGSLTSC